MNFALSYFVWEFVCSFIAFTKTASFCLLIRDKLLLFKSIWDNRIILVFLYDGMIGGNNPIVVLGSEINKVQYVY